MVIVWHYRGSRSTVSRRDQPVRHTQSSMLKPLAELLREGRTAMAETLGAAVAAIPVLERPFIAAGMSARRGGTTPARVLLGEP